MNMPTRRDLGMVGLIWVSLTAISGAAQAASPVDAHQLMQAPTASRSVSPRSFRIHEVHAIAPGGAVIDVPAHTLVIQPGGLHQRSKRQPDRLPAYSSTISRPMSNKLGLYYGTAFGWMLVPRSWVVWSAGAGLDGTSFVLFAPSGGPAFGWMEVTAIPACRGCMWGASNGLIPAAFASIGKDFQHDEPPMTKIVPAPIGLAHPNACTAVLRYQPGNSSLQVRAVMQLSDQLSTPWFRSLHLALPSKNRALSDYLIEHFLRAPPAPVCVSGNS